MADIKNDDLVLHSKRHSCDECDKTFSKNKSLKRHKNVVHQGIRKFKCEKCGKTFSQISNLSIHVKAVHERTLDYKCEKCTKRFAVKSRLKSHINVVHNGLKSHKCEKCERTFSQSSNLKIHVNAVHDGILKFKCEKCNKQFSRKGHLKRHVEIVHYNKKNYKCEKCEAMFGQNSHLKRHIDDMHSDIKKFKCGECEKSFGKNSQLKKHVQIGHEKMKKYKCENCPLVFAHKDYLKKHLKRQHPDNSISIIEKMAISTNLVSEKSSLTDSTSEPLTAESSGKVKALESNSEHIQIAKMIDQSEKVPNTEEGLITTQISQSKISKCDSCDESFDSRFNLRKHKTEVHKSDKKFECEECSSSFGQKEHLKIHVKRKHFEISDGPEVSVKKLTKSDEGLVENNPKDNSVALENKAEMKPQTEIQVEVDISQNGEDLIKDMTEAEVVDKVSDKKRQQNSQEHKVKTDGQQNEEKNYKCRFCQEVFENKSNIQEHIANKHFEDTVLVEHTIDNSEKDSDDQTSISNIETKLTSEDQEKSSMNTTKVLQNFICDKCQKHFNKRHRLKRHIKEVHLRIRNFECEQCKRTFNNKAHLKTHVELVHEKLKKFRCEECGWLFGKKVNLKTHIEVVHEKLKKFKCELCLKAFAKKAVLLKHVATNHQTIQEDPYKNELVECNDKKEAEAKKDHDMKTLKNNFNESSERNGNFEISSSQIAETIPISNLEENAKDSNLKVNNSKCKFCEKCQKSFKSSHNLKIHVNDVHLQIRNYKCNECGRYFSQINSLKRHIELVHQKLKKFKCKHCLKAFSQKVLMIRHIARDHNTSEDTQMDNSLGETVIEPKDQPKIKVQNKTHVCDQCNKSFLNQRNLKQHISDVHLKLKSHKCDQCSRSFSQISTLKSHVECVHEKLKKFKCDQCPRYFGNSSNLKKHIDCVHEKLKKYKCDQCSMAYGQSNNLKLHIERVHVQAKPNSNQS